MHWALVGLLTVAVLLSATRAPPVSNLDEDLISYQNTRDEHGYSFAYRTKDGQYREEQGEINPETGVLAVSGRYQFVAPGGEQYETLYEADENGYRIVDKPSGLPPPVGAPLSNTLLLSLVG